ncbi:MAG: hypothetical protein KBD37_00870 [Burkholderiales bacterium]|nr:hypothetical protein [Burkholderiales bacterium]
MAFNQNYYLTWENGELVTADTMTAFSDGLTAQVLAITDSFLPVILSGGNVTVEGNTVAVTEGYYRVANQQVGYNDIPGYFYTPAASNLTLNNGQYVVARINITTISQYTTIVSGSVIITDIPTAQDVILYRAYDNCSGIIQISRDNDLQLLIPTINKSNRLIINNAEITTLQLDTTNQQVIILAIAKDALITLPAVTTGIYSLINSSNSVIYLVPSNSYTIFGNTKYLIAPGSSVELSPLSINKCWVFL